jgi:hypothetical protein
MSDASIVPDTNLLAGYVKDNSSSSNATGSASSMSPQNSSAADKNSDSGNHDVAIGAGVGIPLGLIALASIGWALRERRRFHAAVVGTRSQPTHGQKAWTYSNSNIHNDNNNRSELGSSQYPGYSNNGAASATAYRQPQTRLTEMESTVVVELDSTRRA